MKSNPHVKSRSAYSENNRRAILQAVRHAGAGGVAVADLVGPFGSRSEVYDLLNEAQYKGFVRFSGVQRQVTHSARDADLVLADDKLRALDTNDVFESEE